MRLVKSIRGCYPFIISSVAVITVVTVGVVFASSEGEHAGGGWALTDTYRLINFLVLAGLLYLLLKKFF